MLGRFWAAGQSCVNLSITQCLLDNGERTCISSHSRSINTQRVMVYKNEMQSWFIYAINNWSPPTGRPIQIHLLTTLWIEANKLSIAVPSHAFLSEIQLSVLHKLAIHDVLPLARGLPGRISDHCGHHRRLWRISRTPPVLCSYNIIVLVISCRVCRCLLVVASHR